MTADYLERLKTRFAESPHPLFTDADFADLRALLTEAEQQRSARTFLDGQVFAAGWYAHAEVSASLGWNQREAAWRQYREEMAETLAKTESVSQQPKHDVKGCPCGCPIVEGMCSCQPNCSCEGDCGFCDGSADGGEK